MSTPMPDFMKALTDDLGLGDTPSPVVEKSVMALLDVVKAVEFTPEGWAHVKRLIVNDKSVSRIPLFQRILDASEDDLMIFTAMIAIPYGLAKVLGYEGKRAEKLISYFTGVYVIAMSRGYDLGAEDSRAERRTRDE